LLNGASAARFDRAVIAQTDGASLETFEEPVVTESHAGEGRSDGGGSEALLLAAGDLVAPPSATSTTRPEIPRTKPTRLLISYLSTHRAPGGVPDFSAVVQQACNGRGLGQCAGVSPEPEPSRGPFGAGRCSL